MWGSLRLAPNIDVVQPNSDIILKANLYVKVYSILLQLTDYLCDDDFCHITLDTLTLQCGGTNLGEEAIQVL